MKRRALLLMLLVALPGPLVAQPRADRGPYRPESAASLAARAAGVESDVARLREEAMRGDLQAQYDFAVLLDCGQGIRRDRGQALQWFRKAAEGGHLGALSALGWKYMTGDGVRRDDAAAFQWLRRAAERGDTSAQNNLGVLYALGHGVAADPAEAAKWFRLAADKGAADAKRNLEALQTGRARDLRHSAEPRSPRT